MSLFHLAYHSIPRVEITNEVLCDILKTSQKRNLEMGITGFLVFRNNRFFQMIEGRQNEVETLYERIKKDPRHRSVTQIAGVVSENRMSPLWSMCLLNSPGGEEKTDSLIELIDSARAGSTFETKAPLEQIIKKFLRDAVVLELPL